MSIFKKFNLFSSKKSKRIVALALMLCIGISSAISVSAFSKIFRIKDGDNVINIRSLHSETNLVLKQAGINIGENDKVVVTNKESNYVDIDIKRAFSVTIFFNDDPQEFIVNDGTVDDILRQSNITLPLSYSVSPGPDVLLTPDMQIFVSSLCLVNINVDGLSKIVPVPQGTVLNALNYLDIDLSENDIVNEPLDRMVENDLNIVVNRVEFKEISQQESIPFSTSTKKTDSLNKGQSRIETPGVNGEKQVTKRIKYVDGVPVQTDIISETILKNPVNQVKLIGTKTGTVSVDSSNGTVTDENGNVHNYKSVLSGVCTAYHERPGARTSTGAIARRGLVAVNPKQIPYGTKMYIPGYGICTAADTGGAMRRGHAMIDLYMDSEQECRNFGRRTKQIYILN